MKEFNIVLAGVGGQGILLAAEVLGSAAVTERLNVRVSEIHGMAQRGGAVVSNVRIGEDVLSSTVLDGQANILLGFEPLETLRNLKCCSDQTFVIMNTRRIPPPEFGTKDSKYPSAEEVFGKIKVFTNNILPIDAHQLAKEAGNALAENSVLVGAVTATKEFPLTAECVQDALRELVPEKYAQVNLEAFELGFEFSRDFAKHA